MAAVTAAGRARHHLLEELAVSCVAVKDRGVQGSSVGSTGLLARGLSRTCYVNQLGSQGSCNAVLSPSGLLFAPEVVL